MDCVIINSLHRRGVYRLNGTASYSATVAFQVVSAASTPAVNVPEEHPNTLTFLKSDASGNGVVGIFDAMYIAQHIVGFRDAYFTWLD